MCLKPTTKRGYYDERPERLAGCVVYQAGTPGVFEMPTVIDTKKTYPVRYKAIERAFGESSSRRIGRMPEDFQGKLVAAIRASRAISNRQKLFLLGLIGVAAT